MKVFFTKNHVERRLRQMEEPWAYEVPEEIKAMSKDSFSDWLNSRTTTHRTLSFCLGDNETVKVSSANQCRQIYGFFADYDGAFSPELIESSRREMTDASLRPAWWVETHSKHLRLVWEFEAPVSVTDNAAAESFLSYFARKVEVTRWGAHYDIASEKPTQLFDIGNKWNVFEKDAVVPKDYLDQWAYEVASKNWKFESRGKVVIPFDQAVAMLREVYPEPGQLPPSINIGTRWRRFWDASSDNMTGIVFFEGGVYNFISGKDIPVIHWDDERLLGKRRCEKYQAELTSPVVRMCAYDAGTNKYWRQKADITQGGMTHTPRTKGDFIDDLENMGISGVKPKGGGTSEMDKVLFRIREERLVDAVVPVLYRDPGILRLPDTNKRVLNVSNVHVLPVPKDPVTGRTESFPTEVTKEDLDMYMWADEKYRVNPSICAWDNPFVTRYFPHVHQFITTLFLPNESARRTWYDNNFMLPDIEAVDLNRSPEMAVAYHQIVMLISWLSTFYKQGESRRVCTNPGQALVVAGPASTGKTFLAKKIIARLAGGFANGVDYFINGGRFTDDIVCSPMLLIDDAISDMKGRDRDKMTNLVKQVVATGSMRSEAKFQSALSSLPWPGRVGIFCNSDAQSLSVLPSLEASTKDKFMMLMTGKACYPFSQDYSVQEAWVLDELPWFALFLMGYHVPERFVHRRYGVKAWQHPEMVKASQVTGLAHTLEQVLIRLFKAPLNPGDKVDVANPDKSTLYVFEGKLLDLWLKIKADPGLTTVIKDTSHLYYAMKSLENHYDSVQYDNRTDIWSITNDFFDAVKEYSNTKVEI